MPSSASKPEPSGSEVYLSLLCLSSESGWKFLVFIQMQQMESLVRAVLQNKVESELLTPYTASVSLWLG